jgi:Bacterial Ig-like domain (group 2)/Abnormal spindle-like microcephaly-assoc'd, ASPM-SPD-2-Hydin
MNRTARNRSLVLVVALFIVVAAATAAGTVSVSPTTLSFGNQVVGTTSAAKTVTLSNGSSSKLTINSVGISGDFAIRSKSCGATLAAGKTCTISVTFTPTVSGARTGALTINDSASNSPQTVSLSGTGIPVSLTSITVLPANPSLAPGGTLQFTATGKFNDGTTQDLTGTAVWTSSASGVATINSAGLATGLAFGPTTITAASGAISGSTTLNVTASGISAVAGQNAGAVTGNPVTNLTSLTFAHNVTAGNQIIVAEKIENYSAATVPSTPTKSSGTATIGPFTQDAANDGVYGSYYYSLRIWRAPITGSGTLTLSFSASAANWLVVAIDEFSGMAASPVDGTPVTNTGTGSTESTGNVVTSKAGMVLMLSSEYSSSNFNYTQSDTNIYTAGDGATGATGEAQYKLTNGAGTYKLTADNGVNNPFWLAVGVAYK